jgi:hypothetical protein
MAESQPKISPRFTPIWSASLGRVQVFLARCTSPYSCTVDSTAVIHMSSGTVDSTAVVLASRYQPQAGGLRTNKLYKNTFHFLKNGPVSGQSESKSSSSSESCSSSSCWLASSNPELPELPELPEDPRDSNSTPESSSLGGLPILIANPRLCCQLLQCIAHPTARVTYFT